MVDQAADERIATLEEGARRQKEMLDEARLGTRSMRRVLRRLAHDSPDAAAIRATIEAELALPDWADDERTYVRRVLAPVFNFAWLVPEKLAGCGRPDTQHGVRFLASEGVRTLISLDLPPPATWLAEANIGGQRVEGFADQTAASAQLSEAVQLVEESVAAGKPVAVHCNAGVGRTGTVLAAYLVSHGASAEEAIDEVRRNYNPRAVENAAQEDAVRRFAMLGSNV
jgi:atypical dual specificity phosphatase